MIAAQLALDSPQHAPQLGFVERKLPGTRLHLGFCWDRICDSGGDDVCRHWGDGSTPLSAGEVMSVFLFSMVFDSSEYSTFILSILLS